MDRASVNKIRISNLLKKHGFLSAKLIANRTKLSLDAVSFAIREMMDEGLVMADDTGRDWGGDPVILFRMSDTKASRDRTEWDALAQAVRSKN